jgi:hypothetical protein
MSSVLLPDCPTFIGVFVFVRLLLTPFVHGVSVVNRWLAFATKTAGRVVVHLTTHQQIPAALKAHGRQQISIDLITIHAGVGRKFCK